MEKLNLSVGDVYKASEFLGEYVRVAGITRATAQGGDACELLGTLSGVTYTAHNIIVYMENSQSTSFLRSNPVNIETV